MEQGTQSTTVQHLEKLRKYEITVRLLIASKFVRKLSFYQSRRHTRVDISLARVHLQRFVSARTANVLELAHFIHIFAELTHGHSFLHSCVKCPAQFSHILITKGVRISPDQAYLGR